MSVLFILSNIAVPFLILSYTSTIKAYQAGEFYCAKWFMLILYTFFSNLLFYYFLYDNKWFILIDLIIKLAIVFIPDVVSKSIEKVIQAFHFELIIQFFRSFIMTNFFIFFCLITQLIMKAMNMSDKLHFKQSVTNIMQRTLNQYAAPTFSSTSAPLYKTYDNTGVQCDILNMAQLNQQRRQRQLLKLQLSQRKIDANLSHMTNHDSVYDSRVQSKITRVQPVNDHPPFLPQSAMKKKHTFNIQRSSTDLGIGDSDDERKIQPIEFKRADNRKSDSKVARDSRQFNRSKATVKQEDEPSMILNKLDVSDYSDMFQDEQQAGGEDKKLVTKVQTIIEIGGLSSARLEIYNIELYSNSEIRIVSLYGRQFERHKLISMRTLKHGYYQLRLKGGKVDSRKVKFRGSFEPFLKYLQPGN